MDDLLISTCCGLLGGLVRSLVGILKALRKAKALCPQRLVASIVGSGTIGAFAALALLSDYRVALLCGYAGMDLLENARVLMSSRREKEPHLSA